MHIKFGVAQDANRPSRDHMEDHWTEAKVADYSYFAVFDGHMGNTVALRAMRLLHQAPAFSNVSLSASERLTQAFRWFSEQCVNDRMCGSTAVVALINPDGEATIAWVGDSFALYATSESHELLTPAHTMAIESERQRLAEYGCTRQGEQLRTRDGCTFPMTRAFGDTILTPDGVIAVPDIRSLLLTPGSRLLLASDGIYPTPNGTLWQIPPVLMRPATPREAATSVVKAAKERWGSRDNLTALVLECS